MKLSEIFHISEGVYKVELIDAEVASHKLYNPGVNIICRIVEGGFTGRKVRISYQDIMQLQAVAEAAEVELSPACELKQLTKSLSSKYKFFTIERTAHTNQMGTYYRQTNLYPIKN